MGRVADSHRFPEHRVAITEAHNSTASKGTSQKASGFPSEARTPIGWASRRSPDLRLNDLSAFPGYPVSFAQFSAITVAGQWRNLTALPNARREPFIDECRCRGQEHFVSAAARDDLDICAPAMCG